MRISNGVIESIESKMTVDELRKALKEATGMGGGRHIDAETFSIIQQALNDGGKV